MRINDWEIYFVRRLFGNQYQDLRQEVQNLKQRLTREDYIRHPTVKLYAAMMRAIKELIPADPFATQFALTGALKRYGRVKKMGLPKRYRLFFRAIQSPQSKAIFIIWLGYPRKEGDKRDCYAVFKKMLSRRDFPASLDDLLDESSQEI